MYSEPGIVVLMKSTRLRWTEHARRAQGQFGQVIRRKPNTKRLRGKPRQM